MTCAVSIPTAAGEFVAHFSEHGLAALDFPGRKRAEQSSRPQGSTQTSPNSPAEGPRIREWEEQTAAALRAALAGRPVSMLPPLDWRGATPFQQSIWRALLRIPTGHTSTYAEVAAAAGRPRAVRAAGGACGANPIPVLVPCHRVVASGGGIGGFSGPLEWKQRLLAREGVVLDI